MFNGFVEIGDNRFPTLIACTAEEHQRGLMFRPAPTPIMSFPYLIPSVNKFWMKNCCAPLDIVFCKGGQIVSVHAGKPYSTTAVGPEVATDLVIELPYGTMEQLRLGVGAPIKLSACPEGLENIQKIYPDHLQSLAKLLH